MANEVVDILRSPTRRQNRKTQKKRSNQIAEKETSPVPSPILIAIQNKARIKYENARTKAVEHSTRIWKPVRTAQYTSSRVSAIIKFNVLVM